MESTRLSLFRAVRTFMAAAPQKSPRARAGAGNSNTKADTEAAPCTARARCVAAAMLRARLAKRQIPAATALPEPERAVSVVSSPPVPQTPLSPKAEGLWKSASSLAKSAYTVHLAHQRRYHVYPTHDLLCKVEQDWAAWGPAEKEKWIKATPQGRKALKLLQNELAVLREPGSDGDAESLTPRLSSWAEKYDARVAVRRSPALDATLPQLSPTETPRLFIDPSLLPFAPPCEADIAAALSPARATLAREAKEAEEVVQEGLWRRQATSLLGSEGAATFASAVKQQQRAGHSSGGGGLEGEGEEDLCGRKEAARQRRRREVRPSLFRGGPSSLSHSSSPEPKDGPQYSDAFLAFSSSLGIHSPRKVYVMRKLLPHLDSAGGPPKTLAEVKELATRFSAEYDANTAELRNSGEDEALAGYNRELLKDELDRLQAKMAKFQSQLPLLMRWQNVLSK